MKQFCWIGLLMWCLMGSQLLAQQTPVPIQAGPPVEQDSTADSTSKRLEIIHADLLSFDKRDGIGVQKLIGDVQLKQDSTLFFCERAYFYEAENRIEVFDSVRVEMPDSVFLFGDRMEYEGDTRVAEVYDNITLTNQQSVLTTDRLTYYREEEYGYYQDGGQLVDDESVLTSEFGYYYPNEDMAYFKKEVELVHPDYTLHTDTLGYNTQTKVAVFLTLTDIISKDGDIQTSSGTYDTRASRVNLTSRSTLKDSSYTLYSDSLDYIDEENIGIARGNVLVVQENT
ncbi:MAG: OstA-like protein [Bacteroidota bacterium]